MTRKTKAGLCPRGRVHVRAYEVVARAVEEGVAVGYRRAHKHEARPAEEQVLDAVERGVMDALCEVLEFDEEE